MRAIERQAVAGASVTTTDVLEVTDQNAPSGARQARVTYFTGWLSPEMEGCSKEVFALKEHFANSRVFGLSQYYAFKLSRRERYFGIHVRFYPVFRALAPLFESRTAISHIYSGLGEWFFLRPLGRGPLILTVAVTTAPLFPAAYRRVQRFVVHSPATVDELTALGVDQARIRLIYPGIDLDRFRPRPRAEAHPLDAVAPTAAPGRFRILFATTPNTTDGLRTRGVHLLIEAARRLPDVDFILPWRPWTGAEALVDACRAGAPANFHAVKALIPDIRDVFQAVDATVAPFVEAEGTKICPTSLTESLACGRPVLVSTHVGIADVVGREHCGQVFEPTVDGLCRAIESLRADYQAHAVRARPAAERHFDLRECLRQHEYLYRETLADGNP